VSHKPGKSAPEFFRKSAEDDLKSGVAAISKAPAPKEPRGSAGELSEEQLNMATGGATSPRDPASGLPTGKRMHKPFTLK
jgi:hypothetical protein